MNDIKSERHAESLIKRFVNVDVPDVIGTLPPEQASRARSTVRTAPGDHAIQPGKPYLD